MVAELVFYFKLGIPQSGAAIAQPLPPPEMVFVTKGGVNNTINLAKFKIPSSPIIPTPAPTWKRALEGINHNQCNIVEHMQRKSLKGYPCLDLFVIVRQEIKDDQAAKNLICWMFVHLNWLSQMVMMDMDNPVVMPLLQHWRDFLVHIMTATGLEVQRGSGGARQRDLVVPAQIPW